MNFEYSDNYASYNTVVPQEFEYAGTLAFFFSPCFYREKCMLLLAWKGILFFSDVSSLRKKNCKCVANDVLFLAATVFYSFVA